jgi:hypothetical protein
MRIAHITQSSENIMLGVEKYVLDLAGEQKARGSSVTVITDQQGLLVKACGEKRIPVIAESLEWMPEQSGAPREATVRSLADHLKNIKPDIINCHTIPAVMATFAAARRVQVPIVSTLHANIREDRKLPYNPDLRHVIISVSKRNIEALRRSGFPEADLHYVASGSRLPKARRPRINPILPTWSAWGDILFRRGWI